MEKRKRWRDTIINLFNDESWVLNGSTPVVQFFTGGYNMTSVLPAWKLELIQKKKLKEQGERQKLEDERSRKVSIPEWKRSLLEKKKEGANDSPETKEQAQSVNSVFGPRIIRKTSEKDHSDCECQPKA